MKIYITRHSKTIWNKEKRLQGRKDSPLTQEGIENALALKKIISNMSFDLVYSSPIQRALHTAQLLFDHQNIILDDRLMEMNFGDFEGRKILDILETDCELYHNLWKHPERFDRIAHGESYDEVIARAQSFKENLMKIDVKNVFIVTHGMFFIVFIATLLGLKKEDFVELNEQVVEGCSLTCIDYQDGEFKVEYYNSCDFLPHRSHNDFTKG